MEIKSGLLKIIIQPRQLRERKNEEEKKKGKREMRKHKEKIEKRELLRIKIRNY